MGDARGRSRIPHKTPTAHRGRICRGTPPCGVLERFLLHLLCLTSELNKHIPHDVYEPPSCDLCLEWLAGKPYRTTADMRWGFHQVLLSERAQKIFTFVTPFGAFACQRLVMGYVNATAEFQRHMNNTLGPLLWDTCLSMVDDLCIASETKEEYRVHVTSVLTSLAQRHHGTKPSKMAHFEVNYRVPRAHADARRYDANLKAR